MLAFPKTYDELKDWDWPQFEPLAAELEAVKLDARSLPDFLRGWSDLSTCIDELYNRCYVATSVDTTDEAAQKRFEHFMEVIYPKAMETEQRLKEKLLASGLQPEGFDIPLRNMRAEADLFCEANLPLFAEEQKLTAEYDKIIAAQTVTWEGEERTVTQLHPLLQETDRELRERAWRAIAERQLADRERINAVWQKLLALRQKFAENAGRPDYRAYRWQQLLRFDYTPQDCARFHDAIEEAVVPAVERILERRRKKMKLDALRPWDTAVDPLGRPPLRPFSDTKQLIGRVSAIFHRVDPELGDEFDLMDREGYLDLDNRKGKAPGGYCTNFALSKRPFIFMNAVGLHDDAQTLLHEGGHCFHAYECFRLPYFQQTSVPMEFAEVASMGMELLASPYLTAEQGGFYSPADAARALTQHLESTISFWPYMAVVDAFQHWVYEVPSLAVDPAACDEEWGRLWDRFQPGVDWSGFEDTRVTGWQRKLHIFEVPFYYVEYGLAQLGAYQIWRNARRDQAEAVRAYRQALRLGGTAALPKLYEAAGARLAFDADTLREMVALGEQVIEELEKISG